MGPENSDLLGQELAALEKAADLVIEFLINYSFQILGALIVLTVGLKLSGWLARFVLRVCEKRSLDVTLSRFLASSTKLLIMIFVVIIAIGKFGISIAPFIAALGALAFGSSFAIQGPLSNYGAGLTLILTRPFVVGNTISVQGVSGVVEEIRLAATILTSEDGEELTIPNKHIVGEILRNSFENKIIETRVGISYQDDPERAIAVLAGVLADFPEISSDPPVQVGIEEFADSAITIGLRFWVPTRKYYSLMYQVHLGMHRALNEAGVAIPYPQQDIHVRTLAGKAQEASLP